MKPKERQALGRGFSALLKPVADLPKDEQGMVLRLKISDIVLNPKQPRSEFNLEALEELSQSIKIKGVIQPVIVRKVTKDGAGVLELVAGERRLRASKLAGFTEIPAIIKEIKDEDLLEIALIENIQRSDLSPIEESLAYQNLLNEHGYTQEDLARRVGKNRSTVANMLRLLQLPKEIQKDLASGKLTTGHARCLLSITDSTQRLRVKEEIISKGLSVREAEKLAKAQTTKSEPKKKPLEAMPAQMQENQDRLESILATKVRINDKAGRGKIELDYSGEEEFNRLFALLLKRAD
ncbi:MAG: ParB/RepB/Spo0J family partition protein [SAR324 cluster bacterium]|nr:ParB/RepB/Spo0J family partition protein [SAR324 cluster bacterium]